MLRKTRLRRYRIHPLNALHNRRVGALFHLGGMLRGSYLPDYRGARPYWNLPGEGLRKESFEICLSTRTLLTIRP